MGGAGRVSATGLFGLGGTTLNGIRIIPTGGLCTQCTFSKTIVSDRGSQFTMCQRSKLESRYPKYPRLPVRMCEGFVPMPDDPPPEC